MSEEEKEKWELWSIVGDYHCGDPLAPDCIRAPTDAEILAQSCVVEALAAKEKRIDYWREEYDIKLGELQKAREAERAAIVAHLQEEIDEHAGRFCLTCVTKMQLVAYLKDLS